MRRNSGCFQRTRPSAVDVVDQRAAVEVGEHGEAVVRVGLDRAG